MKATVMLVRIPKWERGPDTAMIMNSGDLSCKRIS